MSAQKVFDYVLDWAKEYDPEFYNVFSEDPDYSKAILSIGRGVQKPRKDFAVWSDVRENIGFFFDPLFSPDYKYPEHVSKEDVKNILERYISVYDPSDDQSLWFSKIRSLSADLGFAADMKEFKADPGRFKGNVGDVSSVIRMAATGKENSPDMFIVLSILGKDRVVSRIKAALGAEALL